MRTIYQDLVELADLAPLVGEDAKTLQRWASIGLSGRKLRALKIGGKWKSSLAWFEEWVRAANPDLPPIERQGGVSAETARALDALGVR